MSWPRIRGGIVEFATILYEAGRAWSRDNGSRMAAALAFYTVFSIAPLLMLAMGVAGFVFDEQTVRTALAAHLHEFVGPRIEEFVWEVVERWQDRQAGLKASLVALLALGWSTFRGFDALRATLNMIWGVEKRSGAGIVQRVLRRAGTFVMTVCVGAMIVASIVFSTVAARVTTEIESATRMTLPWLAQFESLGLLLLVAVLFAMIFKWAANVEMEWSDAIVGAAITAVMFGIGKFLIELVLTHFSTTSVFGAAGAMVALLLWVYLSAMIFFYGAEVTKYWAIRMGNGIEPDATAVRVENLPRIRQAITDALGAEAAQKVDRELGIGGDVEAVETDDGQ